MKFFILFFAFLLCVSGIVIPKLPKCKKDDPHLNKCLIDAIETIRPILKGGIPEAGIPAMDPFVFKPFEVNREDGNFQYQGTIEGMRWNGGGAFKIDKLAVSIKDNYELDLSLTIPTLDITAHYKTAKLNILTFRFSGKGKFSGKFTDVKAVVKVNANPNVKNGLEYLNLVDLSVKVNIGNAKISLKEEKSYILARAMAISFNARPSIVLNILRPTIDQACTDVVKDVLKKAFDKVPISAIIVNN